MIFGATLPKGAVTGPSVVTTADIVHRAQVLRAQAAPPVMPAANAPAAPLAPPVLPAATYSPVADTSSFFAEHKTGLLVGGGIALATGIGYYLWRRRGR
jgi:hypothetical protein